MKLARKIVLALFLCFFAAFGIQSVFRTHWAIKAFEDGLHSDHHQMGRALGAAFSAAWRNGGEPQALAMIQSANEREEAIRIRWRWLDELAVADPARQALARGEEASRFQKDADGHQRLFTWIPVPLDESRRGVLELSEPLSELRQYERRTVVAHTLSAGLLILVCGALAAALGIRWVARPMATLAEKARRIGGGDLSGPLTMRQKDEIGDLAAEINKMCEGLREARELAAAEATAKLAAIDQLRHADRLTSVGRLASGLAHGGHPSTSSPREPR
jgi:two-component system, NtrC family, sensor kinase